MTKIYFERLLEGELFSLLADDFMVKSIIQSKKPYYASYLLQKGKNTIRLMATSSYFKIYHNYKLVKHETMSKH